MKNLFSYVVIICTALALITSCANKKGGGYGAISMTGISYTEVADTLDVNMAAAVFYEPCNKRLDYIRSSVSKQVLNGSMHEYIYQLRNAHIFLKQHWPRLGRVEAGTIRFLRFWKNDTEAFLIDTYQYDPYGLFVFDKQKLPQPIDMTNIVTQVPEYFTSTAK